MEDIRKQVSKYYSNITTGKEGQMETKICSCQDNMPDHLEEIRSMINPEIIKRFYGCNSPIPPALEGYTVLDLECETGLDVYIASKLVDENEKVIGVGMTDDQLSFVKKYQNEVSEKFDYKKSNVKLREGYTEDLKSIGIEGESINAVISNCVVSLSPFKKKVFKEVWRVLKGGGELYFSNIFVDRKVLDEICQSPVLRGGYLTGAMYVEDLKKLLRKTDWEDFGYTKATVAPIENEEIKELAGNVNFTPGTVRATELPGIIENKCERYGQFATYRGGMVGCDSYLDLGDRHGFFVDLPMAVCGNSCAMVQDTRFGEYSDIIGDRSKHFDLFDGCGDTSTPSANDCYDGGSCCC